MKSRLLQSTFCFQNFSYRIYKNVPTSELINSYIVLKLCRYDYYIDNVEYLSKTAQKILGNKLFYTILKSTMGQHFTAGETSIEAKEAINKFHERGFKVALGYMAEFTSDTNSEKIYDETMDKNIETLHLNKEKQEENYFFAIKFTGLTSLKILRKMNDNQEKLEQIFMQGFSNNPSEISLKYQQIEELALRIQKILPKRTFHEIIDFLKLIPKLSKKSEENKINLIEWRLCLNSYNIINPDLNSNEIWKELTKYTSDETKLIESFLGRIHKIVKEMRNIKSFLLMDAEQSFVQKAINNITEQIMYIENYKNGHCSIFNTVQNYLESAEFTVNYELSKKLFFGQDYPVLLKLVRGAYHKEEQRIEKESGKKIVFSKVEQTHGTYNRNCLRIIDGLCEKSRLFVASHNEETVDVVSRKIECLENKEELIKQIYFGTLLGLNDRLAYQCLSDGKTTVKFMPFGERELTLPYMIRRSYEAKDLIQKNSAQVSLFSEELKIRFFGR